MKVLKGYVRSYACPEGCIAECYLSKECLHSCSKYMKQTENVGSHHIRNEDYQDETCLEGHPLSKGVPITISPKMLATTHHYILFNSSKVEPYIGYV